MCRWIHYSHSPYSEPSDELIFVHCYNYQNLIANKKWKYIFADFRYIPASCSIQPNIFRRPPPPPPTDPTKSHATLMRRINSRRGHCTARWERGHVRREGGGGGGRRRRGRREINSGNMRRVLLLWILSTQKHLHSWQPSINSHAMRALVLREIGGGGGRPFRLAPLLRWAPKCHHASV